MYRSCYRSDDGNAMSYIVMLPITVDRPKGTQLLHPARAGAVPRCLGKGCCIPLSYTMTTHAVNTSRY